MKKKRIALIEIGGSHDECLLTQMHAIQSRGHEMLLLTTPEVADRNPSFDNYTNEIRTLDIATTPRKQQAKWVWNQLKSSEVELAVLNTAQGKVIRSLCMKALFSKIEFVGVIHTTRMFTESFTQKIIHQKIKKYLLLSQFLKDKVLPQKGLELDYFYPLHFPSTKRNRLDEVALVAIIGGVEERRKDLGGFVEMVKRVTDKGIHFVFLGKSDPKKEAVQKFFSALKTEGLQENVTTYDHFVSQNEFDRVIQESNLILPLVHPDTPSADQYFRNQISGAMTVSFGYKIPMMVHEAYHHIEEMQKASFYYTQETFANALKSALENSDAKALEMREHPAYLREEQERRYANFLGL